MEPYIPRELSIKDLDFSENHFEMSISNRAGNKKLAYTMRESTIWIMKL